MTSRIKQAEAKLTPAERRRLAGLRRQWRTLRRRREEVKAAITSVLAAAEARLP